MRRARFYILILGLTLLPQVVAASDLVRWLAAQGQLALGLSVPGDLDIRPLTVLWPVAQPVPLAAESVT